MDIIGNIISSIDDIDMLMEIDHNIHEVEKIIYNSFHKLIPVNNRVTGSEYYLFNNPNTTWKQYIFFNLMRSLDLMDESDIPYLPLAARLAFSYDVGLDKVNDNGIKVRTLMRIMKEVKLDDELFKTIKDDYSITYKDLFDAYKSQFSLEDAVDAEEAEKVAVVDNGYDVIEITDFETAKYYGDFSCSKGKLCYTQDERMWNQFKAKNRVYLCLKNGWKEIDEKPTNGNPYDDYGLSMVFVFITPNGEINMSSCRWNHCTEGKYLANNIMQPFLKKAQLARMVGKPFRSVFKA